MVRDVFYGAVWSRHVILSDGCEVEFSFGAPSWANATPVDQGTLSVISKGWHVLLDRQGLLTSLVAHATYNSLPPADASPVALRAVLPAPVCFVS